MELPVIQTPTSIALALDNRHRTFDISHPNFEAIRSQLARIDEVERGENLDGYEIPYALEQEMNKLRKLVDIPTYISEMTEGNVEITDKGVLYRGQPVEGVIVERMMQMLKEKRDVRPLMRFLDRVHDNPDTRAQSDLYRWLESGKLPITPDGAFLAYKYVRDDYMDCYTGQFRNRIGDKPKMKREDCDPDPYNECSRGLHFCSYGYLGGSPSHRYMIVKVAPENVVAIPIDYSRQKGRAWTYEVVGEVPPEELGQRRIEETSVSDGKIAKAPKPLPTHTAAKRVKAAADKHLKRLAKQKKATTGASKSLRNRVIKMVAKFGQRETERRTGIPRTTIQHWLK